MDSRSIGIIFIAIGIAALIAGLPVMGGGPDGFGRPSGDVRIERENTRIHFPIATTLLPSMAFSLVLPFARRFL